MFVSCRTEGTLNTEKEEKERERDRKCYTTVHAIVSTSLRSPLVRSTVPNEKRKRINHRPTTQLLLLLPLLLLFSLFPSVSVFLKLAALNQREREREWLDRWREKDIARSVGRAESSHFLEILVSFYFRHYDESLEDSKNCCNFFITALPAHITGEGHSVKKIDREYAIHEIAIKNVLFNHGSGYFQLMIPFEKSTIFSASYSG